MTTEWRFTVAEADHGEAPQRHKPGSVTLELEVWLGFYPTVTQTEPQWLAYTDKVLVMSLEELLADGHGFFTRLFSSLPSFVHPENLDTHGLAWNILSLAPTAVPLRVIIDAVTVMPSADIEREKQAAAARVMFTRVETVVDREKYCTICNREFGSEKVLRLTCSHRFHNNCIVRRLKRKRSCPTCGFVLRRGRYSWKKNMLISLNCVLLAIAIAKFVSFFYP